MVALFRRYRSDEALMEAYRDGDTGAFEVLYGRHKDGLFAFLYRSLPRPAVVEELAQETWVGVINAAGRYRPDARFRTWLYQIAHNKLVDFWRRPDNRHSPLGNGEQDGQLAAETQASRASVQQTIIKALARLPEEQKNAVLLQEQGFSQAEIAGITGVGVETVKSRLRYARSQLRDLLGDTL